MVRVVIADISTSDLSAAALSFPDCWSTCSCGYKCVFVHTSLMGHVAAATLMEPRTHLLPLTAIEINLFGSCCAALLAFCVGCWAACLSDQPPYQAHGCYVGSSPRPSSFSAEC